MDERKGRREPVFDLPAPLVAIAVSLVAIHFIRDRLDPSTDDMIMALFAFIPDRFLLAGGAPAYPGGWGAMVWTFVSHALLHGSWMHVLLNTVMLAAVGRLVILRFGTARLLALFAASAAGGAACHLVVDWGSEAPMIGASGVVFGTLGASLRFAFVPYWQAPPSAFGALKLPRVRGFVLALVLMNLVLVLAGTAPFGGGDASVAWGAHLGGFLVGFFGFRLFDPPRRAPSFD